MENHMSKTSTPVATSSTTTAASTVVQNDIPTFKVSSNDKVHIAGKEANTAKPISVTTRVMALVKERKAWEHGAYVVSNNQLYAILDKCYAFYFDLRGNEKEAKAARAELDDVICKKGYSFKEDAHTLTKLVKFVFDGVDRRRVSAYSLVLRAALFDKIAVGGIPAFITAGGGVEQIRRRKSGAAMSPKQKAELGKQTVSANNLAVISSPALQALADDASEGDSLIAVVTVQADGSLVVRALVNNKSVLTAALACAYSKSKSVVQNDKLNAKAANDDKSVEDMINDAVSA
jgi:hypothetical protein